MTHPSSFDLTLSSLSVSTREETKPMRNPLMPLMIHTSIVQYISPSSIYVIQNHPNN